MATPSITNPTSLARRGKAGPPIKVWDPLVRILHSTMSLGVIANLTLLRENKDLHNIVGYVVLGALTARILFDLMSTASAHLLLQLAPA
jgi:cytochrome b